ncbi:GNAT family N-acetyltransferase [Clostridium sp. CF012]|uniref:GNAT family N-acetyltransferase n=1 Tax=Clostridium sp. CF012 TaxID=2843319 RepID=UPI001C0C60D6|nr:GNAT family protein [Clostridium sp. CF012]MBU3145157.1 GNAT family N-acetyltransferase [Clostridium sp. CF012]
MWIWPEKNNFEGNRVRIGILNPKLHYEDLYEMAISSNDEDNSIFRYMAFGPFINKNEMSLWLEKQSTMGDRNVYSIYSKRLKKYVGMYSIINIDEKNGRVELGSIWYGKEAQRTEINTETTYLMLKYLFEDLKYRRIEWKCDNKNNASKNAATRLGFVYEGLFRKHMIVKDKNRDTSWYSIIDDEWDEVKKTYINNIFKKYGNRLNIKENL